MYQKICLYCYEDFSSDNAKAKFCSVSCRNIALPPWNKGLTKETDERVRVMGQMISQGQMGRRSWCKGLTKADPRVARRAISISQALQGKRQPWVAHRMRVNNPMKRLDVRRKVSIARQGLRFTEVQRQNHSKILKQVWKSPRLRLKRLQQKIPYHDTKCELTLFQLLDFLHIKYETHKPIENICQADASIAIQKIAIFADGCYWHACQQCFKEHPHPEWRTRDENYTRIMQSRGWLVLRFWEHELNHSPNNLTGIIETLQKSILVSLDNNHQGRLIKFETKKQ